MKVLPSKLFPNCSFSPDKDAGFYDITPKGFEHAVSLYLGSETVKDDMAIENAARFFDRVNEWNSFCRDMFQSVQECSADFNMVMEYFDFYRDQVPEVFGVADAEALSLPEMVNCLKLDHMGTHGSGSGQEYHVDFTLGYDQLLCVYFDSESKFNHMAWES